VNVQLTPSSGFFCLCTMSLSLLYWVSFAHMSHFGSLSLTPSAHKTSYQVLSVLLVCVGLVGPQPNTHTHAHNTRTQRTYTQHNTQHNTHIHTHTHTHTHFRCRRGDQITQTTLLIAAELVRARATEYTYTHTHTHIGAEL